MLRSSFPHVPWRFRNRYKGPGRDLRGYREPCPGKTAGKDVEGGRLNRLPGIGDGELELPAFRPRAHLNRRSRCAVDERVAKQVGEKLADALAIAFDWLPQIDIDCDIALGCTPLSSSMTCRRTGSNGFSLSRVVTNPPPNRPRAKSRTFSISSDMREMLRSICTAISAALSGRRTRSRVPAATEASGFLRSCPSTAMNCSRSSASSFSTG